MVLVRLYRTRRPHFIFGSDVTSANYTAVVCLTNSSFAKKVANDGGLNVLALTPDEVWENIQSGVIVSGQAALTGWHFYQYLSRVDLRERRKLIKDPDGYLVYEETQMNT